MKFIYYLFLFFIATLLLVVSEYLKNSDSIPLLRGSNNRSIHPIQLSDICKILSNNSNSAYSQFGQDLFLYHNFFKQKTNGYYIELGSYHPTTFSNLAFFDQCLKWNGLCLDMNDFHEKEYLFKRNCKFVKSCVSNRTFVDYYKHDDALANGNEGTSRTYCEAFDQLLENHTKTKQIDLLSIDIEGEEYYALQTFDFNKYNVSYVLVETYHNKNRNHIFDYLQSKGFVHIVQIGPDDLFENRFNKYWFPTNHNQWKKDIENDLGNS